jgi:hypothetical protein
MALFPLGILSAAGAGGADLGSFDLLESQILGSAQSSVTFSSLGTYSSTYKHLQIRFTARSTRASTLDLVNFRFNGDTGSNYSLHRLTGNGSSVSSAGASVQPNFYIGFISGGDAGGSQFGAGVADLLDPFSTTKNKTVKSLTGSTSAPELDLYSGAWYNTASVTSFDLFPLAGNFVTGSRFSLYGIKG